MHVNPFRLRLYADQQVAYAQAVKDDVSGIIASSGLQEEQASCVDHSDACRDWALAGDCILVEDLRNLVCCASCAVALELGSEVADTKLREALDSLER